MGGHYRVVMSALTLVNEVFQGLCPYTAPYSHAAYLTRAIMNCVIDDLALPLSDIIQGR